MRRCVSTTLLFGWCTCAHEVLLMQFVHDLYICARPSGDRQTGIYPQDFGLSLQCLHELTPRPIGIG